MLFRRFVLVFKPFQYTVFWSNRPPVSSCFTLQFSCWKCGSHHDCSVQCTVCQATQDHTKINYFELFELQPSFDVDTSAIVSKYHKLQIQFHPDKHSNDDEEEKTLSANFSTLVNKAYSTLSNTLNRAVYLLELNNVPLELTSSENQELLRDILELSDYISNSGSEKQCGSANKKINEKIVTLRKEASFAFKLQDYAQARKFVVQMKYYYNLLDKLKERRAFLGLKT